MSTAIDSPVLGVSWEPEAQARASELLKCGRESFYCHLGRFWYAGGHVMVDLCSRGRDGLPRPRSVRGPCETTSDPFDRVPTPLIAS